MIRGLYTSAIGMGIQQTRLDTVSNNLSNAGTAAFRRDVVVTQSFGDMFARRVRDYEMRGMNVVGGTQLGPMSLGVNVNTIHRDFSAGNLRRTEAPLDLALDGGGFFIINFINNEGEAQEMYTRAGNFTLATDGTLVTLGGFDVLDVNGQPINIPNGTIIIGEQGHISVDGEFIAQIGMVDFENLADLRPFGHNFYTLYETGTIIPFTGRIHQGYIEESNVNIVREMVEMISISRTYEANSRMVQIQDETLRQAVNDIARGR
ncbi:MAG: flagellar basal-body rod protein FlgF [Defluviitaleaceae bacterium]|nr:flagellar basal-body rod protein FlgF [Defluviitaleaceae bacterium]